MRELGERAGTEREGQIEGSRRIGIGLSSSPPNFNWELTRFPVRCNSRRDAARRPPLLAPGGRGGGVRSLRWLRPAEKFSAFSVTGRELFTYTSAVGFAIALPILPSFSVKRGHFVRGRRYRDTEIGGRKRRREEMEGLTDRAIETIDRRPSDF